MMTIFKNSAADGASPAPQFEATGTIAGITDRYGFLSLSLFGEGAGGAAGGDAGGPEADGSAGAQESADDGGDDAGSGSESFTETKETEARKQDYENFRREYKDELQRDFERQLSRRLRGHDKMESELAELRPIADFMKAYFGESDNAALLEKLKGDDDMISELAARKGMTNDAMREFLDLKEKLAAAEHAEERRRSEAEQQRRDEYMADFYRQLADVKAKYPSFDPETMKQNDDFVSLVKAGVSVEAAYRAVAGDEIMEGVAREALREGASRAAESLRQRRGRPSEVRGGASSPGNVHPDVSKMTRAQREDLERRALMGEKIIL